MAVKDNPNYISIIPYNNFNKEDLKTCGKSFHMNDRTNRMNVVKKIEKNPQIDNCFLVDKGHRDGQELHVVTKCGIVYIYNFMKLFRKSNNALITVCFGRPSQIKRLYNACHMDVDDDIINNARIHVDMGLNNV